MSSRGPGTWLAALALSGAIAANELFDDSVQREWQIREWAFEVVRGGAPESLRDALEDADWVVRWSALEALNRGAAVGADGLRLAEDGLALLADEHPNVRVAAVRLATASDTPPSAPSIARLAADDVPAVRLAAATWLADHPSPAAQAALVSLLGDPDERVAGAARSGLFASPAHSAPVASSDGREDSALEWDRFTAGLTAAGSLEFAPRMFFGAPSSEWLAAFEATSAEWGDSSRRAWGATLAVIRARHGMPFEPEALIDGWFADEAHLALRRTLLPWVSFDEAWTEHLAAGIAALEGTDATSRWTTIRADLERLGLQPEDAQREWVVALAAELGAEETLRRVVDWPVRESTRRLALEEVASRFVEWDLELGRAWAARSVEIRVQLAELWGGVLMRGEDPVVGELLTGLLSDPDEEVRASAFRWLCKAARPVPYGAAIHRAWRAVPEPERLVWLARTPRAALTPFRDDLLELGRTPGRARAHAVEHLEQYANDEGVAEALRSWLREELELFGRSAPDSAQARDREGRVVSLVRALSRLDLEANLDDLEAALEASQGKSEEIGKTAAAAVGRSSKGRELLTEFLGESVDLRTRIEAALQIAGGEGPGREAAALALRRDYGDAAWDLRGRIIDAWGRVGSERAVDWLRELADEGGRTDRLAPPRALDALALCQPGLALPILQRAATRGETESRGSAIAALARLEDPTVTDFLASLYTSEFDVLPNPGDEPALFLREALLTALAGRDAVPAAIAAEVLRGPLREAEETLERRFRSEHEPAPGFRWRGELKLWAALSAEQKREVLAGEPRWRNLDARFLLALADRAEGELRLDLLRAGLIGWGGEGDGHRAGHAATRSALLEECLEREEWSAAAAVARSLRRDLEHGVLAPSTWEREVGRVSRIAGWDSLARVRSLEMQALAWAAFEAGDLDTAREWASEAARTVGWSERAQRVQAALEERLEPR